MYQKAKLELKVNLYFKVIGREDKYKACKNKNMSNIFRLNSNLQLFQSRFCERSNRFCKVSEGLGTCQICRNRRSQELLSTLYILRPKLVYFHITQS